MRVWARVSASVRISASGRVMSGSSSSTKSGGTSSCSARANGVNAHARMDACSGMAHQAVTTMAPGASGAKQQNGQGKAAAWTAVQCRLRRCVRRLVADLQLLPQLDRERRVALDGVLAREPHLRASRGEEGRADGWRAPVADKRWKGSAAGGSGDGERQCERMLQRG